MMKKVINQIVALAIFVGTIGCSQDYLEVIPDNRTTIDSKEKIQELLVNAYPVALYVHFAEIMSDNAGDKGNSRGSVQLSRDAYNWVEIFSDDGQDYPEYFWNESFSNIAAANQALESLDELNIDDPEIPAIRAEARIARAYAHFMLVSLWSKSYDPSTADSDLGIPIVTEPENVVFKDYNRASVAEVFDFIENEIEEAIPDLNDDIFDASVRKYHFNSEAAHAFATRFYLFKGDWPKVIEHANEILTGNVASRLIDWNGARASQTYGELTTNYTAPDNPANLMVTEATSWWGRRYASERFGLTLDIRDKVLFGDNPTGGNWAYRVFGAPGVYNVPKFDENFVPTTPGGNTGLGYLQFALFRIEEVLLSRAEASLMTGDFSQAVSDLNTFYSKRISNYSEDNIVDLNDIYEFYNSQNPESYDALNPYYNISADKIPVLHMILNARRADYMHEGIRWFDIRRFGITITHRVGDSEFIEEQEPMILPGDSPAHQLQIPPTASSVIEENPR